MDTAVKRVNVHMKYKKTFVFEPPHAEYVLHEYLSGIGDVLIVDDGEKRLGMNRAYIDRVTVGDNYAPIPAGALRKGGGRPDQV